MTELRLTPGQLAEMRAHVESHFPEEACGLLAGANGIVHEVIPITNMAGSPVRFRMDPVEQLRALERMDGCDWELLAIFHSHPAGPPRPSATDIAEAAYDVLHIIWSPHQGEWQAQGFWIRDGAVSEVKLLVADGEPGSTSS